MLAAVLGGRTRQLLRIPELELFTVDEVLDDVTKYAPALAARRRLSVRDV